MGGSFEALCGIYCSSSTNAVYGTFQVPAAGNQPGDRFASAGWADNNGNFWLFGGEPSLVAGESIYQNDLWEYQPANGPLPTVATPSFSVPAGSYGSAQNVTISDATNGAFIYYTTDGSTPTVSSTVFLPSHSEPIEVQNTETLKAIAVAAGCNPSALATAVYTLPPQAATPAFSLAAGTYTSFQTVTISDATPSATIYYTIDGSTPTTGSNVYKGPLNIVNAYTPLQAVAIAPNYSISSAASAIYMLNLSYAAAPTFSVGYGTYNTPQTVSISDTTPGATIYYQINTGYPTTSSPVYSGPITVSSTESIWAMAIANNYFPSGFTGATYIIDPLAPQTVAPTFSVPAGTYTTPQTVTISDSTQGASIYYSTDGSTPGTNSTFYSAPITVSSSETLQAIATAGGDTNSSVASAIYAINLPPPAFTLGSSPNSLTVNSGGQGSVTLTVTPQNGFNSAVSFACSGLPSGTSCSFSPSAVTPSGSAMTTQLTISASAQAATQRRDSRLFFPTTALAVAVCLMGWKKRRRGLQLLLLVAAFTVLCLISACGGGGATGVERSLSHPQ
jgi:hypothetical protein